MEDEVKERIVRPGGVLDAMAFGAGLLLGLSIPLAVSLHGLSGAARTRALSAGSFVMALGFWVPLFVFVVSQGRRWRRGELYLRRPALLGSLVAGAVVGIACSALAQVDLPALLFAAACVLPWCASRALWKADPD